MTFRSARSCHRLRVRRTNAARFWGLQLKIGRRAVVRVPPKSELLITRACSSSDVSRCTVILTSTAADGREGRAHFPVLIGGTNLPICLSGDLAWKIEVRDGNVDLAGFVRLRRTLEDLRDRLRPGLVGERIRSSGSSSSASSASVPSLSKKAATEILLPPGWAGLSFRSVIADGKERLIVSEVPKVCFSSAAFGTSASPQISGVCEGDEIVSINGESPSKFALRIATAGDSLNSCAKASPGHIPGTVGKLDATPCISCDFVRRSKAMGLDVALHLWIRAVKRDTPIRLGIQSPGPVAVPQQAAASSVSTLTPETGKTSARYNPLRPAAKSTGSDDLASKLKATDSKPKAKRLQKKDIGGFMCVDTELGNGNQAAKDRQKVLVKFQIRLAKDEKKILERGEIEWKLGEGEVIDGWVDGNVDMEEVLAAWGRSLIGMSVGGRRRVWIPPKRGFRDGGGEAVPSGAELLFDAELKKIF